MTTPQLQSPAMQAQFAADVRRGLSKRHGKSIPPQYFYDDVGSALFDAITLLPEYGLTRADQRLLRTHSPEILETFGRARHVVELGSGSGTKTRFLLEAAASAGPVHYYPIDVSASALARCKEALEGIADVSIRGFHGSYLDGLRDAVARRAAGEQVLVLFLGSTIGNFDAPDARDFLQQVQQLLDPGDGLLLGTDLVKPERQLLAAYDDELGVTAAFNLNLLARINRELGGNFALARFRHEARWSRTFSRVEMHLRSLQEQRVRIEELDLDVHFEQDETIWTESSHKFESAGIRRLAHDAGMICGKQWIDSEWGFAESLLLAAE